MAEALIEQLREAGRVESSGSFDIDREQARRKLQKFRLRDPHEYLLQFVEAAHLLEASWIEIEVDADEVEMVFDGSALRREELENIYASAFGTEKSGRQEAIRHLAIGLMTAQEVDPAVVRVESAPPESTDGGEAEGVALVDDKSEGERLEPHAGPERGTTRIYLRETVRLYHIPRFFHKFQGELVEQILVRRRCRHADIPVELNGERVSEGRALPVEVAHEVSFEREALRGRLGVASPSAADVRIEDSSSSVRIVQNGVWTSTRRFGEQFGPARNVAVVAADRLRKNLSQSKFVEDERLERLLEQTLPEVAARAIVECIEAMSRREWYFNCRWLRRLFLALQGRREEGRTGAESKLLERLAELPIWPAAVECRADVPKLRWGDPPLLSLESCRNEDGELVYATRPFPEHSGREQPVLFAPPEGTNDELIRRSPTISAGRIERGTDVTLELSREVTRRRNRQKWESRPPYERPDADDYPVYRSWTDASYEARLYLTSWGSSPLVVDVVKEGRRLESFEIEEEWLPEGRFVVAGPFETTSDFSRARRGKRLRELVFSLGDELPAALAEVVETAGSEPWPAPTWFVRFVRVLIEGALGRRLYDRFASDEASTLESLRRRAEGRGEEQTSEEARRVETVLERYPQVADASLVDAVPDGRLSLRELVARFEEEAKIPYVVATGSDDWWADEYDQPAQPGTAEMWRELRDRAGVTGTFLIVRPEGIDLLDTVVGGAHVDVEGILQRRIRREAFLESAPTAEFDSETYAATAQIDREEFSGRIGLRKPSYMLLGPPSGERKEGSLEVTFAYEGRAFTTERLPTRVGHFVAVLDSTRWVAADDFSTLEHDALYQRAIEAVRGRARVLFVEWCREAFEEAAEPTGEVAAIWAAIERTRGASEWSALQELTAFATVDGRDLSYRALRNEIFSRPKGAFATRRGDVVEELVPDAAGPVLWVPDVDGMTALLRDLFSVEEWVDATADRDRRRSMERARASFLERPEVGLRLEESPLTAFRPWLERSPFEANSLRGELAVCSVTPRRRSCMTFSVLYQRRLLETATAAVPFGRFVAVVEADFVKPTALYDDIHVGRSKLERRLRDIVRGRIEELVEELGAAPGSHRELRGVAIRWVASAGRNESIPLGWRKLVGQLRNCPLFETWNHGEIGASDLERRVARAGGRLCCVSGELDVARSGRSRRGGEVPIVLAGALGFDVKSLRSLLEDSLECSFEFVGLDQLAETGRVSGSTNDRRDDGTRQRTDGAREGDEPERPSRSVASALFDELRHYADRMPGLPDGEMESLEVASTDSEWIEVRRDGTIRVDPRHPAVDRAVRSIRAGGGRPDPVAAALFVSSFYTMVNRHHGPEHREAARAFHVDHGRRVAEQLDIDWNESEGR